MAKLNTKHTEMPMNVGRTKESTVHFKLPVSFLIVRQVVEQGQWKRQNSIVETAVTQVQPLFVNNVFNSARLSSSKIEPVDI